jgi:hypothetical protein
MKPGTMNLRTIMLALAAGAALAAAPLGAQQPDTLAVPDTLAAPETLVVPVDTIVPTQTDVELPELDEPMTPGGAMLRAALIPGWGHASIGSYRRGAFYFAAETTTGFFLARTARRLSLAKDARDLQEDRLREELLEEGANPDSIPDLLDQAFEVRDARGLVNARRQQLEDWIAFGAFLLFIGAADAFVSAHLRDFPEPLEPRVELITTPAGAAASVGFSVGVGPPR